MTTYNTYERRLADALAKQADLKHEIEFLRLQLKQEAKQCRWAKSSPVIKQFKAQWPDLRIDNGAGMTYLGLTFSVLDHDYEQHLPVGWVKFEERIDSSLIGSPIQRTYKYSGIPALLYVTKAVR
jgi:hypothetical protein